MNPFSQLCLFSCSSLAVITSTIMMNLLAVEVAKAQPQPSCFMINTAGEVVNLEDICNVKPQEQIKSNSVRQIKNAIDSDFTAEKTEIPHLPAEMVYFVGNGSFPFTLGTSSAAYYSGERFTYVRRYREAQRFSTRNNARDAFLRSQANTRSIHISGRTPFIIYRYQK